LQSLQINGFDLKQVIVVENTAGRYSRDDSNTFKLLSRREYQAVQYRYVEAWGSKPGAVYAGVVLAEQKGYEYVLVIDDDVMLSEDFDPRIQHLKNERMGALSCKITTAREENICLAGQKQEYEDAGDLKDLEYAVGTVLAPHGAISLWKNTSLFRNSEKSSRNRGF